MTGSDEDPRVTELRGAVARLRRELAALRADFPDRAIAEEELAALAAMAAEGSPEIPRLRGCLLLVAGAIGSMSALARPLREVRDAVDLFGQTAHRAQGSPSGGPASRPGDRHGPAAAGRSSDAPR